MPNGERKFEKGVCPMCDGKLHFNKGDVLVAGPAVATYFSSLSPKEMDDWVQQVGYAVPVIIDMTGEGVTKLSREQLVQMLESATA